ncbi:MAG: DNA translocase FtsK [Spirochaetales bacterium]|jgi:S-DNA-T family DNA segregation ATPase FtsK/SpoIIIE|nr:DNA translocase FtsK [Spirochaetales bacterium]
MKLRFSSIVAAVLSLIGTACFVCLVVSFLPELSGGEKPFWALPGIFFFTSFHYAAFFIPLYFWSCAFLLLKAPFRLDRLILLNYLILPFFTLGISLRLFTNLRVSESPVTVFFIRSFSGTGGAILTALMVLLELTVIPQIALRLRRRFYPSPKKETLPKEPILIAGPQDAVDTHATETQGGRTFLPLLEEGSLLANRPLPSEPEPDAEPPAAYSEPAPAPIPAAREESEEDDGLTVKFTHGKMIELAPLTGVLEGDDEEAEPEPAYPGEEAYAEIEEGIETDAGDDIDGYEPEEPEEADAADSDAVYAEDAGPVLADTKPKPALLKKKRKKYHVPVEGILAEYAGVKYWEIDEETRRSGDLLRATLEEFKIQAEVVGIRKGPVITMFEILPEPGVKLSKITNLADNIALRLAASSVRIVAPIPGKHAVGIEIPNKNRAIVSFAELINAEKFSTKKMEIPLAIGKDITGEAQIIDLVDTPHLLIAGTTGSGKSVCVNSIICSILYNRAPEDVKLILIDPKIVELKFYNDVPHLLTPVITEPKKAFQALQYAISEMEQRYELLNKVGARDIRSFNHRIKTEKLATTAMPYIVIIIDEFADLMATTGKEMESTLARLAAMSRAVGIHLILATQRPSIDVITGLIKANIPSRIAFKVAGKFDSRIIIDAVGAEKLLGQGDMLFVPVKNPVPARLQGAYLAEEEVEKIVAYVKTLGEPDYIDDEIFIEEEDGEEYFEEDGEDPLLDKAIEIVTLAGKASASYLQRRLKIGYNRAARMVETMEHRGIVGPQDGSKARQVLGGAFE